jgi:hypothetical protein
MTVSGARLVGSIFWEVRENVDAAIGPGAGRSARIIERFSIIFVLYFNGSWFGRAEDNFDY